MYILLFTWRNFNSQFIGRTMGFYWTQCSLFNWRPENSTQAWRAWTWRGAWSSRTTSKATRRTSSWSRSTTSPASRAFSFQVESSRSVSHLAIALAVINEHNRVFVPFRMINGTSCFACHSANKALQHCVQILLQLRLIEHYTGKSISMLVFGPMNYNQSVQ